jgi:general secretion pathway protein L
LRFADQEGFSVPLALLVPALDMLITAQKLGDNLPQLVLRAAKSGDLDVLYANLPEHLAERVKSQDVVNYWQLDFEGKAIDLCQAEFSQRLPLERWMKLWRGVGILALVTFVVYVGVLGFHIVKLNKQNLLLRQQMESTYRSVVPNGKVNDPEKDLRIKVQQLQPKAQSGSVMSILAGILPIIASNSDVTVKVISYSSDTGEMSINVQAHSFNSIDALRQAISLQGFTAELLTANAQGDINTGRLKITKPQ